MELSVSPGAKTGSTGGLSLCCHSTLANGLHSCPFPLPMLKPNFIRIFKSGISWAIVLTHEPKLQGFRKSHYV